jgi:membrane-bound lytic murein transglycosylase MltF
MISLLVGLVMFVQKHPEPSPTLVKRTAVVKTLTVVERLPDTVVSAQERRIFNQRKKVAVEVETYFRKQGIHSDKAIVGILVNAWHESKWDPRAVSPNGSCVGLFQLSGSGLGRGMTVAQRQDIGQSLKRMSSHQHFLDWKKWVDKHPNASAGEMSYQFAKQVERCARQHRAPRRTTGDKWFAAMDKEVT